MARYPEFLRPQATRDLVRVGALLDGGYVLPERLLGASKGLLSFGLSDEFEFEKDFASRAGVQVACFDHTVGLKFWLRRAAACLFRGAMNLNPVTLKRAFRYFEYRRFFSATGAGRHIKRALGYPEQGALTLLQSIEMAELPEPLFLKMDIEGWEYRLLDDIVRHRSKFCGMAMELHDLDLHEDRVERFLADISDQFVLIHFHPNTHTQVGPDGYALAVELTLMNRSLLDPDEMPSYRPLPIDGLDEVNLPGNVHRAIEFGMPAGKAV